MTSAYSRRGGARKRGDAARPACRLVVIKLIRAEGAATGMWQHFEPESEALGRLHHPGIAQI
jgi:hypothetical protein